MIIKVLPFQPHSLAFGGFEIQMLSALQATRSVGINVERLDVWSQCSNYDILHVWGLEDAQLPSITWAKKSGKKVVLSALLPYLSIESILRGKIGNMTGFRKAKKNILSLIDHLVVVNEGQARAANIIFNVPKEKISIIPNMVSDLYFNEQLVAKNNSSTDLTKYVISTGSICWRKNQILLAKAAIEENIPLLIIGKIQAGEEKYHSQLMKILSSTDKIRWIDGLEPNSISLKQAYSNSVGFALISKQETQPISALEAAAMNKPLLLSNSTWAKQSFYENARLCDHGSISSIQMGLRDIINNPRKFTTPNENIIKCSQRNIGERYAKVYLDSLIGSYS
jgi:glycosyltransferase involved in cell wall biosynthesis